MSEPPLISAKQAIKVFEQFGWSVARWESSHISLKKPGMHFCLTIVNRREVPRGTLRQNIVKAGLTVDQFIEKWRSL